MTEKQMAWTAAQQKKLNDYIVANWPPDGKLWTSVSEFIAKTVAAVAEKDPIAGEEVRSKLFDVSEHYEREARAERKK